eukprot:11167195-Lingulodinium_polyedra.AAC.1
MAIPRQPKPTQGHHHPQPALSQREAQRPERARRAPPRQPRPTQTRLHCRSFRPTTNRLAQTRESTILVPPHAGGLLAT